MNKSFKIAVGTDLGQAKTKEVSWDQLVKALSTHETKSRKGGKFFVGGYFKDGKRLTESMVARSLITLDIDDSGMTLEDLEFTLFLNIPSAFIAYSTYSHTPEVPKVRVVIPMNNEVTPLQYTAIAKRCGEQLGVKLDPASYVPNQAMFMPSCPDSSTAWAVHQDGELFDVEPHLSVVETKVESNDDDLSVALKLQPLALSDDDINAYLDAYPSVNLEYDQWLQVGAALHHQYQGTELGFNLWVEWSAKSPKHDQKLMPNKWRSFGRSSRPVTFASIIYLCREAGGLVASNAISAPNDSSATTEARSRLDEFLIEASEVDDLEGYSKFKSKISKINSLLLPSDYRTMIASELADGFGKQAGLTKAEIKKALEPKTKKNSIMEHEGGNLPEWVKNWVYIESICEFAHLDLNYSIKREAFNAKYDREMECVLAEKNASTLALNDYRIQTVVDKIYWPSAGKLVHHEGKLMLNTYVRDGVDPALVVDEDGQAVIDLFLRHVEFTLVDKREQSILLDFFSYIIQNQGSRINWALLLQGAQGTGKSYFVNVMQYILGSGVRNIDPSAVSGRFTGWAYGAILNAIEEIRIAGANKYEILDRMKPFVTNNTIQIEEKGRDHRVVPNFASYFLLTNHKDALPVNQGDRRYCILYGRIQSEEQLFNELGGKDAAEDYFDRLFSESERRADALAYFFYTRKLSGEFNAKGRAPETASRLKMMEFGYSNERNMVEDAIDTFDCPIINKTIVDVTWLNKLCVGEGLELPKGRVLPAVLLELGYSQIIGRKMKINKTKANHYLWFKGDESDVKNVVKSYYDNELI